MKNLNHRGISLVESLLIIIALALIIFTGYYIYHSQKQVDNTYNSASKIAQNTPSTSNTTRPTSTPLVKAPADAQAPAASSCAPQSGTAVIRLDQGVPSPRCVTVNAHQIIRISNPNDFDVVVTLGAQQYTIKADEAMTLNGFAGDYLEPGVHILHSSIYGDSGAEIWLK
jgi:Flp pilus assembly protein TadG